MKCRGTSWTPALAAVLLAVSPVLWGRLEPNEYEGGRSRDAAARQVRNASAIGMMLGEFRTGISDILMIKTERYLHSGIGYQAHMDEEILSTQDSTKLIDAEVEAADHGDHEHDDHEHDDHSGTKTLIASPEEDYRGFIGQLHRHVKPWRDPSLGHLHTDGRQLLPWFRVATLADPRHVRSYTIGGYWLSLQSNEASEKFLLEGIEKNAEAFQLHLMLGKIYFNQAKELDGNIFAPEGKMLELCRKSRAAYREAAELALVQRPEVMDESTINVWGPYDEEDAWAAFRMAALTEQQYGSDEEAKALAGRIVDQAGSDPILNRLIQSN